MSYDVTLRIDTGGLDPVAVTDTLNYTYNCGPMFALAIGGEGLRSLHGKLASECIPILRKALDDMRSQSRRPVYEALNPENGWGDHRSATEFLANILQGCEQHPKTTVHIT